MSNKTRNVQSSIITFRHFGMCKNLNRWCIPLSNPFQSHCYLDTRRWDNFHEYPNYNSRGHQQSTRRSTFQPRVIRPNVPLAKIDKAPYRYCPMEHSTLLTDGLCWSHSFGTIRSTSSYDTGIRVVTKLIFNCLAMPVSGNARATSQLAFTLQSRKSPKPVTTTVFEVIFT